GLCPGCLLKQGLDTSSTDDSAAELGSYVYIPPTAEQLAAKFPELEILEFIGRGGMGIVYKARQKHLNRVVALKILHPRIASDPAFAEDFVGEARAPALLSHPHVGAVHDFGKIPPVEKLSAEAPASAAAEPVSPPLYYFLMEYVDGVNLRQLLQTK